MIASAKLLGAERVIAIDTIASRLNMARAQGAETIDYNAVDPVQAIDELTRGLGPSRVVDAVGVDANRPHSGPAAQEADQKQEQLETQRKQVAPKRNEKTDNWHPGDAPSQVATWAVQSIAKGGTLGVIGVYPQTALFFPIGAAQEKQLKINMGNCNHRKYIPELIRMVATGAVDPAKVLTEREPVTAAIDAYKAFDERQPGWIKVELEPAASATA